MEKDRGKKIKKILTICLMMMLAICMAGCSKKDNNGIPENGEIPSYTERDLPEGTYIKKAAEETKPEKFQQLLNMGLESDNNGNFFTWHTAPYDDLIPRFQPDKGDTLIFYSESKRPSSYTIYKMTDYGYTLGMMFNVQINEGDLTRPNVISFAGKYNPTSIVESVVKNAIGETSADIQITEINQKDFKSTLLVDESFLKGLTEQTMYNIGFYCGTVFKQVMVKSDTHLFLQERASVASNYVELKDKYFEIILPSNMEPGYYFIEDVGLFYYEGSFTTIDEAEGIEAPDNEEDTSEVNEINNMDVEDNDEQDIVPETQDVTEDEGIEGDMENGIDEEGE